GHSSPVGAGWAGVLARRPRRLDVPRESRPLRAGPMRPPCMTRTELIALVKRKRSLLCVGLDTELHRLPKRFRGEHDPVRAFNHAIIKATHHVAVAYKLNLAFYEANGSAGWRDLESTVAYLRSLGDCLIIADAKRGDIG